MQKTENPLHCHVPLSKQWIIRYFLPIFSQAVSPDVSLCASGAFCRHLVPQEHQTKPIARGNYSQHGVREGYFKKYTKVNLRD
jgi:hypothetical protein